MFPLNIPAFAGRTRKFIALFASQVQNRKFMFIRSRWSNL